MGIPPKFVHQGGVLSSMTPTEAEAYHDGLVGGAWSWRGNWAKMIESYQLATRKDRTRAFSFNNLAWLYAAAPDLALRNGAEAVKYGKIGANLFPDGDNLDTLGCAYAQNGQFDKAIDAENAALASGYVPFNSGISTDIALFARKETCSDPTFGKDQFPFRPHVPMPTILSERAFFRLH
jgi:tetratricopeptide (TPR) repeat protein